LITAADALSRCVCAIVAATAIAAQSGNTLRAGWLRDPSILIPSLQAAVGGGPARVGINVRSSDPDTL
ncbi:MAG: hypothetical protein K8I65_06850, partial [Thermoanaerobaculia bacterium]|nr:hypothetical protein [Thermoanaerobaculia bacterium]